MNGNFIKTLRQQDLKIFNRKEIKYQEKHTSKEKENKIFLNNL